MCPSPFILQTFTDEAGVRGYIHTPYAAVSPRGSVICCGDDKLSNVRASLPAGYKI